MHAALPQCPSAALQPLLFAYFTWNIKDYLGLIHTILQLVDVCLLFHRPALAWYPECLHQYCIVILLSYICCNEYIYRLSAQPTKAIVTTTSGSVTTAGPQPTPDSSVRLNIYPPWVSVEPGKDLELNCRLECNNETVCEPPPTVSWSVESGSMSSEAVIEGGRLTVPSVSTEDERYYICKAESNKLSLSVRTVVLVREKCE